MPDVTGVPLRVEGGRHPLHFLEVSLGTLPRARPNISGSLVDLRGSAGWLRWLSLVLLTELCFVGSCGAANVPVIDAGSIGGRDSMPAELGELLCPEDTGACFFRTGARVCDIGAVCSSGDGLGYCECAPGLIMDACSICTRVTGLDGGIPTECVASAECLARGACIFDKGCASPQAFCSAAPCEAEAREYCGCDGMTFVSSCPERAYAHLGPCP